MQAEQRGSGHAAAVALEAVPDLEGPVLLLNGDVPLLRAETVRGFVEAHLAAGDALTVLTAEVDDPTGLGRIVRDGRGGVRAIVEERDATAEQRAIREINAGVYIADAAALRGALARLRTDNDQGEQYVTDVVGLLVDDGAAVGGFAAPDPDDVLGCNDRRELADRRRQLNERVLDDLMRAGVTVIDPRTTWVDVTATVAADAVLHPGVQLHGRTSVATGAEVGPDSTLIDTTVGEGARVVRSHCTEALIGPRVDVGPFAYLRPGTRLGEGAKVGTFVETKNADIGEGSKVPHLSYVGDATIGRGTNIGAASVFVNYDGVHKHHTTIGDHARTGRTTCSWRRSRWATARTPRPVRSSPSTCLRGRWAWRGRRSAMWQAGCAGAGRVRPRQRLPNGLWSRPANSPRNRSRRAATTSRGQRVDECDPAGHQQEPDALLRPGLSRAGRRDRRPPGRDAHADGRVRVRQR